MRIVNVITVNDGVVGDAQSFGVSEGVLPNEVADAENLFKECAVRIGMAEAELDDCLSDGYFEGNGKSVCIVWTEV
jgi:hypothetical protein